MDYPLYGLLTLYYSDVITRYDSAAKLLYFFVKYRLSVLFLVLFFPGTNAEKEEE